MTEILIALNRPCCLREKIFLFTLMFAVVGIFLVLVDLIHIFLGIPIVTIQVVSWAFWFVWQGVFFERNRKMYLKNYPQNPYKAAYYRDILFGVAFGISQMLRPFYHGILHGTIQNEWSNWSLFFVLIFAGLSLMIAGFSTIGFAAAGFLFEFIKPSDNKTYLVEKGIYRVIRHPLFLGGTIAALGSGMIFGFDSKILGIVNICILPIYHLVENHRQTKVLGQPYTEYSSRVGAFLPNLTGISYTAGQSLKPHESNTTISQEKELEMEMNLKP